MRFSKINHRVVFMINVDKFQLAGLKRFLLTYLVLGLMLGCNSEELTVVEKTFVQVFSEDPQSLGRGKALFLGSCASQCHTFDDLDAGADNLFDCYWYNGETDDELFNIVTDGIPNTRMVGFGTNFPEGDDDLWKIIAFVRFKQEPCL